MKAIASLAIAGILAATSLATTTTAADAGGKHWKHHGHHGKHHHSRGWNPGAAVAAGAILGLTVGALAAPTYYYPPPVYYYPPPPPLPPYPTQYSYVVGSHSNAQHVSWCSSRYRSYNARYNSWVGFDGIVRQCVSPFPY